MPVHLNQQPIEKRVHSALGILEVHSVFKTIQGEGPFCGTPCVFVRLAGCNLQCPWCDTDYTSTRRSMTVNELLFEIRAEWCKDRWRKPGLVVITGGEPFRQDLDYIFEGLLNEGYFVQVETNGTLAPADNWLGHYNRNIGDRQGVYVVCSPKAGKVNPRLAQVACCFKYVVSHDSISLQDGLPILALGHTANPTVARPPIDWEGPVYLQPMDAQDPVVNKLNYDAARDSCIEYGYILQLQIHKIIGVD